FVPPRGQASRLGPTLLRRDRAPPPLERWRPATRPIARFGVLRCFLKLRTARRRLFPISPSFLSITMPKEKTTKRATKRGGEKKKKDPNAPKRGLSAYMFFANEQRDNVRDENPGISFGRMYHANSARLPTGQVGKLLGERWKALNDKQRAPYEAKAAADKKRYETEKASYNADGEEEESS
ncbi:hypothetical protein DH86_00003796, partial [Scytalidium sp. 3C]